MFVLDLNSLTPLVRCAVPVGWAIRVTSYLIVWLLISGDNIFFVHLSTWLNGSVVLAPCSCFCLLSTSCRQESCAQRATLQQAADNRQHFSVCRRAAHAGQAQAVWTCGPVSFTSSIWASMEILRSYLNMQLIRACDMSFASSISQDVGGQLWLLYTQLHVFLRPQLKCAGCFLVNAQWLLIEHDRQLWNTGFHHGFTMYWLLCTETDWSRAVKGSHKSTSFWTSASQRDTH